MTPEYAGVMTPRAMSKEAAQSFQDWQAASLALRLWRTDQEYNDLTTREEEAWEKWQEYAAGENRCQDCGVDLSAVDGWPYAYCYAHVADDYRKDWDAAKGGLR